MPYSFFLVFPSLPRFTKKDVDECNISPDAAALCDAIRAVFFLSRSIRKERTLWLAFASDLALIRMAGDTLRYLGPDERSTLMLVDKAAGVLQKNPGSWMESTPGVSCRAGIDPGSALALVASERPGMALVDPTFVQMSPGTWHGIGFPPDMPGLAASRGIVVVMTRDGSPVASWVVRPAGSSLPEQLINVQILLSTGSPILASKILAVNMIEDNARGSRP